MNHLHFAITSLVDAQTGLNLSHNNQPNNDVKPRSFNDDSSRTSFGELIQSIYQKLTSSINRWVKERQNRLDILDLSERQLEDIGVETYAVNLLRAGVIKTDDLKKPKEISNKLLELEICKTAKIQNPTTFSVNQPDYKHSKSA